MANSFYYENIINSLRFGIVPSKHIEKLTVGRDEIIRQIKTGIEQTASGRKECMIFEGAFGTGKSHTINYTKSLAISKNFVVSSISADQTILFNKMDRVLNVIIDSMEFPDIKSVNVFDRLLHELLNSSKREQIIDWCDNICLASETEVKFKLGIKTYAVTSKGMHLDASEDILRWLRGEKVDEKRIKQLINTFLNEKQGIVSFKIGKNEIIDLIHVLGQMIVAIGYSGWLIMIDECENFYELSPYNNKMRHKIFSNLDKLTSGFKNIFTVMTITPGKFDQIYKFFQNIFSEDRSLTIPGFLMPTERSKIVYKLSSLKIEHYKILLNKIVEVYEKAFVGYKVSIKQKIFIEQLFQNIDNITPRLIIKSIIEALDYFYTYNLDPEKLNLNIDFESQLKNYIEHQAEEINNENDMYKPGKIIVHKKYGGCKVLEASKLSNGSINLKVLVLRTNEEKFFDPKFAEFVAKKSK